MVEGVESIATESEHEVPDLEGTHEHKLDAKGRISIPAEFRNAVGLAEGNELVLTRHLKDQCLLVFWASAWEDYKQRIDALPRSVSKQMRRVVCGMARRAKLDRLGRVQVPHELRQFAGLDGKCFVMGQGRYIELWAAPIWNAVSSPDNFTHVDLDEFDI